MSLSQVLMSGPVYPAEIPSAAVLRPPGIQMELKISEKLGSLDEFHTAECPETVPQNQCSAKTVIYIQDAHDSLEAQENIAKLIHTFVGKYGVRTVLEEGYEGPVPTDKYFGTIQDPKVRQKVAYFLMDKLRLGAAEYAHITRRRDFKLIGADSLRLHQENIESYQVSARHREETAQDLEMIDAELRKMTQLYFTRELKEWMGIKEKLGREEIDLLDYLKRTQLLFLKGIGFEEFRTDYPTISLLLSALETQDAKILSRLKTSVNYKTLFREINRLEDDYAQTHLIQERDRQVFRTYKLVQLLKRLNHLEVTEEEYSAVKEKLQAVNTGQMADFVAQETGRSVVFSKLWEKNIQSAFRFYEIAHERDGSIQSRLEEYAASADTAPVILVYGGFHKGRVKELLEQNGFSYAVVSPRISAVSPKHQAYYEQLMHMGYDTMALPKLAATAATPPRFFELAAASARGQNRLLRQLRRLTPLAAADSSANLEDTLGFMDLSWAEENRSASLSRRSEVRLPEQGGVQLSGREEWNEEKAQAVFRELLTKLGPQSVRQARPWPYKIMGQQIPTQLGAGKKFKNTFWQWLFSWIPGLWVPKVFLRETHVIRFGSIIFIGLQGGSPQALRKQIQEIKAELGDTYAQNAAHIILTPPVHYVRNPQDPFPLLTYPVIGSLIAQKEAFEGGSVVDLGAAHGLLAHLAFKLGGEHPPRLFLVDNEETYLEEARVLLSEQGLVEGQNFVLIQADLTDEARMQEVVRQYGLDRQVTAALIHIGPWKNIYGSANRQAVKILHGWSGLRRVFNGGYPDENSPVSLGHEGVDWNEMDEMLAVLQAEGFQTQRVRDISRIAQLIFAERGNSGIAAEAPKAEASAQKSSSVAGQVSSEMRSTAVNSWQLANYGLSPAAAGASLALRFLAARRSEVRSSGHSEDPDSSKRKRAARNAAARSQQRKHAEQHIAGSAVIFKSWPVREEELEREVILRALTRSHGNVQVAAKHLHLSREELTAKTKAYGIRIPYTRNKTVLQDDGLDHVLDLPTVKERFLRQAIEEALRIAGWVKPEAARLLALDIPTLDAAIERLGVIYPLEQGRQVKLSTWAKREEEYVAQVISMSDGDHTRAAEVLGIRASELSRYLEFQAPNLVIPLREKTSEPEDLVTLEEFRRSYLMSALIFYQFSVGEMVRRLDILPGNLSRWMSGFRMLDFLMKPLDQVLLRYAPDLQRALRPEEMQQLFSQYAGQLSVQDLPRLRSQFGAQAIAPVYQRVRERQAAEVNEAQRKIQEVHPLTTEADFVRMTESFKGRFMAGASLEDLLPEALAVFKEAAKFAIHQEPTQEQITAGIAIHQGAAVEMEPSEGKTLSIALAAYLNALAGRGVHIHTFNNYLALRDSQAMGKIFSLLGLTVGVRIDREMSYLYDPKVSPSRKTGFLNLTRSRKTTEEKKRAVTHRDAYESDITYGVKDQFVFDFLEDQRSIEAAHVNQLPGGPALTVVDEGDSVMLDEAYEPLILASPAEVQEADLSLQEYALIYKAVSALRETKDYDVDLMNESVNMRSEAVSKVLESLLRLPAGNDKFQHLNASHELTNIVHQALLVKHFNQRDSDYILKKGRVVLVDEFTGRLREEHVLANHRHQLIAAKEVLEGQAVQIKPKSKIMGIMTYQNYYRMVRQSSTLSMITGTIGNDAPEVISSYNLHLVRIPLQFQSNLIQHEPVETETKQEKDRLIIEKIRELHASGRPSLIFVRNIQEARELHDLLNQTTGLPAQVIDGLDLNHELSAISQAGQRGQITIATNVVGRGVNIQVPEEVNALGGLAVIMTRLNKSRRIDLQSLLRTARRGNAGEAYWFLSKEDEAYKRFGAQLHSERFLRNLRTKTAFYDDVIDSHRRFFYEARRYLLEAISLTRGPIVRLHIFKRLDDAWQDYLEELQFHKYRGTTENYARLSLTGMERVRNALSEAFQKEGLAEVFKTIEDKYGWTRSEVRTLYKDAAKKSPPSGTQTAAVWVPPAQGARLHELEPEAQHFYEIAARLFPELEFSSDNAFTFIGKGNVSGKALRIEWMSSGFVEKMQARKVLPSFLPNAGGHLSFDFRDPSLGEHSGKGIRRELTPETTAFFNRIKRVLTVFKGENAYISIAPESQEVILEKDAIVAKREGRRREKFYDKLLKRQGYERITTWDVADHASRYFYRYIPAQSQRLVIPSSFIAGVPDKQPALTGFSLAGIEGLSAEFTTGILGPSVAQRRPFEPLRRPSTVLGTAQKFFERWVWNHPGPSDSMLRNPLHFAEIQLRSRRQDKSVTLTPPVLAALQDMTRLARKKDVELEARIYLKQGVTVGVEFPEQESQLIILKSLSRDEVEVTEEFEFFHLTDYFLRRLYQSLILKKSEDEILQDLRTLGQAMRDLQASMSVYSSGSNQWTTWMPGQLENAASVEDVRGVLEAVAAAKYGVNPWWTPIALDKNRSVPDHDEVITIHTHPKNNPSPPSAFVRGSHKFGDIYRKNFFKGEVMGIILDTPEGDRLFLFHEPELTPEREAAYLKAFHLYWMEEDTLGRPAVEWQPDAQTYETSKNWRIVSDFVERDLAMSSKQPVWISRPLFNPSSPGALTEASASHRSAQGARGMEEQRHTHLARSEVRPFKMQDLKFPRDSEEYRQLMERAREIFSDWGQPFYTPGFLKSGTFDESAANVRVLLGSHDIGLFMRMAEKIKMSPGIKTMVSGGRGRGTEALEKHLKTKVVPQLANRGQSHLEKALASSDVKEAALFSALLQDLGVDGSQLVQEDQSDSTYANLDNVIQMLKAQPIVPAGEKPRMIIYVTEAQTARTLSSMILRVEKLGLSDWDFAVVPAYEIDFNALNDADLLDFLSKATGVPQWFADEVLANGGAKMPAMDEWVRLTKHSQTGNPEFPPNTKMPSPDADYSAGTLQYGGSRTGYHAGLDDLRRFRDEIFSTVLNMMVQEASRSEVRTSDVVQPDEDSALASEYEDLMTFESETAAQRKTHARSQHAQFLKPRDPAADREKLESKFGNVLLLRDWIGMQSLLLMTQSLGDGVWSVLERPITAKYPDQAALDGFHLLPEVQGGLSVDLLFRVEKKKIVLELRNSDSRRPLGKQKAAEFIRQRFTPDGQALLKELREGQAFAAVIEAAKKKRSEVRTDEMFRSSAQDLFETALRRAAEQRGEISEDDAGILRNIANQHAWAVEKGCLKAEEIIMAYFGGASFALHSVRDKIRNGIRSWSELLFVLEMYPELFERLYIDLDNTLFSPAGYTGSEAWFREQIGSYSKRSSSLRAEKSAHERRLLEQSGMFQLMEPGLAEHLRRLKQLGIQVTGLTAREPETREDTERILQQLGVEIPVVYAGRSHLKRSYLAREVGARDSEIEAVNAERLEAKRTELAEQKDSLPEEVFEQKVRDAASLEKRKAWLFLDDRMDSIFRAAAREKWAASNVLAFLYQPEPGVLDFQEFLLRFYEAAETKEWALARARAIDVLSLMRLSEDAQKRSETYGDLSEFVLSQNDHVLTMAFIESLSDFLARGLDKKTKGAEELIRLYFRLVTPHNPEMFAKAYVENHITVRTVTAARSSTHPQMNYEIRLNPGNIYLFLEPLLRQLRSNPPDVLILPDTGARPFVRLIEDFLKKENLDSKVAVVRFPISRNTAGDTVYEVQRWLRLVGGTLPPHPEEAPLVAELLASGFEVLKQAKNVAVLDDNITSGETVRLLEAVLTKEGHLKSLTALTPFAYRSAENYSFPVLSTFRLFGDYSWRSEGSGISPPVAVVTDWEYDSSKRGARSRKRFQTPPATAASLDSAEVYQTQLLEAFQAGYQADLAESRDRPPVPLAKPQAAFNLAPLQNLEVSRIPAILPDSIVLGEGLALRRARGAVPNPAWIFDQNALRARDLPFLKRNDVFFYEILNDHGVLGFVVLAQVKDSQGRPAIVVQRVQPKMETEQGFDPGRIVEGLKDYLTVHGEPTGIFSLYMDAYEVTMTRLSQSHWVRRELRKNYKELPRESNEVFLGGQIDSWINGVNILWRRTSAEENGLIREAQEYLETLASKKNRGLINQLVFRSGFIKKIQNVLAAGIPLEASDYHLLKKLAGFIEKNSSIKTLSDADAEWARTQIFYAALVEENEGTEENLEFPERFFYKDAQVFSKNNRVFEIRIRAAMDYFLRHLWEGGADISRLTREDLSRWGLGAVYNYFGSQKGRLLEWLAPSAYELKPGTGYIPRQGAEVPAESFTDYIKGQRYRIAPGMIYRIPGDQDMPEKSSRLIKGLLNANKGGTIEFIQDLNFGLLGIVKDPSGQTVDYLYPEGENGAIANIRRSGKTERALGWLDVKAWVEEGREVIPRPEDQSFVALKLHLKGYGVIRNLTHIHVGEPYGTKEVVGVLRQDLNHGTVLDWYLNEGTRVDPVRRKYINTSYHEENGEINQVNRRENMDRNVAWLDIVKWRQGRDIRPRPETEAYTSEVGPGGIVRFYAATNIRFSVGTEFTGQKVMGTFREDINYGTVLEWHLNEGTAEVPQKGALLNAYYWQDGHVVSLNRTTKRTFGQLDFISWVEGRPVKPRGGSESQLFRKITDSSKGLVLFGSEAKVFVGKGPFEKGVVASLHEDLNHGVLLEIHENRGAEESPVPGNYINSYYWDHGVLTSMNESRAKGRTVRWLDIVKWFRGETVTARPGDQSFVTGKTEPNGNFALGGKGKGIISVGVDSGRKEVVGVLTQDPNHGTLLYWYENQGTRSLPVKGKFLTGHYFSGDRPVNLNASQATTRTFGWLDVAEWQRGKPVTARPGELSRALATVNTDGTISLGRALKSSGGRDYGGERVIGILREDEVYGTVLEWFLNTGTDQNPVKGKMINAVYRFQGKTESLQKASKYERTWGWLDIWLWGSGHGIKPRENGQSSFAIPVGDRGVVFWGTHVYLTVGLEFEGKNAIAVLRNDLNHGTVLDWYENTGTLEKPVQGRFLNGHYWEPGKDRPVPLNITTGSERTYGWLDVVKWLKHRKVKERKQDQSYAVAKVNSGKLFFENGIELNVGAEYNRLQVVGVLRNRGGATVLDLHKNIGTRDKPVFGELLFTYDQNGKKISRSEVRRAGANAADRPGRFNASFEEEQILSLRKVLDKAGPTKIFVDVSAAVESPEQTVEELARLAKAGAQVVLYNLALAQSGNALVEKLNSFESTLFRSVAGGWNDALAGSEHASEEVNLIHYSEMETEAQEQAPAWALKRVVYLAGKSGAAAYGVSRIKELRGMLEAEEIDEALLSQLDIAVMNGFYFVSDVQSAAMRLWLEAESVVALARSA